MKKLTVVAFLAALGLTMAGCGGGGGSSSATSSGGTSFSGGITIKTDSEGFSAETKFVDESGAVTSRISEIKSVATDDTPPDAPTFARSKGSVQTPTAPVVVIN